MLLGAVADDITGATDLSLMPSCIGLGTMQAIGRPAGPPPDAEGCDAIVVALKPPSSPATEAVAMSVAAGARQTRFKNRSTFDSTGAGSIGPVTAARISSRRARRTFQPAPDQGVAR
jgi:uncharacterized protein YgbK (DUF1537 family)